MDCCEQVLGEACTDQQILPNRGCASFLSCYSLFTLILATPATVLYFAVPFLYVKFCIVLQAPLQVMIMGFFFPFLIKVHVDPLQGNTREAPSGNFQWQFSPTVLPHNDCMFV